MKRISVCWHDEPVEIPGIPRDLYQTENAFAVYCADWLRKRYELTGCSGYNRWHHSANEREGARAGLAAKLMGQSKGMPDFVHFGMRLAIELKLPGRTPTPEQIGWLRYFASIGWSTLVAYNFSAFEGMVTRHIEHMPSKRVKV